MPTGRSSFVGQVALEKNAALANWFTSTGANLSGDLANPNRDIGRGTIAAVAVAVATYAFLIFGFASGFERDTLKSNMSSMEARSLLACLLSCPSLILTGILTGIVILTHVHSDWYRYKQTKSNSQNVAWPSKYIIVMGVSVSAFSSALGSVFGGSRVLQALGRDDLPPGAGLSFFAKGSGQGDEPRRAVLMSWFVAQCACLIGDIDVISPIIASFFLLVRTVCEGDHWLIPSTLVFPFPTLAKLLASCKP